VAAWLQLQNLVERNMQQLTVILMRLPSSVCARFDAEGREPTWKPPVLPKVENKSWIWRGITQHFVNAHIQVRPSEMWEEGASMQE
jgi:hypothetical protein